MAISGQQTILIGQPNESTGSDSLFTAFTKINDNFDTLFGNSSPISSINSGSGINVANTSNILTITNTGVLSLTAGDNSVTLTSSNGNIIITANGGGNGGGVSNVNVVSASNTRITSTGGPIISAGTITLDLASVGNISGTYTNPTVTVDNYGRVTAVSNNTITGTVASVGLVPGTGIQISGSPITTSGNITVTNTGVTRLNAGAGITLSSSNGNITISAPVTGGTVTSVGVSSSTLSVTGSPIVTTGVIGIELPANVTVTGRFRLNSSEDLADGAAANLNVTATYFSTSAAETGTLAAGTEGQIKTFMMYADSGDMVITVTNAGWKTSGTGTMTFDTIGDSCTLQYINSKWFCIGNNGVIFA